MTYQSLEIFLNSVLDHLLIGVTNVMGNLSKNQIIIGAFGSCLGNGVFFKICHNTICVCKSNH